jgi:hypothetical protein
MDDCMEGVKRCNNVQMSGIKPWGRGWLFMNEAFHPSTGSTGHTPERFFVYRTRSGRTLLASKPKPGAQLGMPGPKNTLREKVCQAVTYAEFASQQAIYQCRAAGTQSSAYHLAVGDYLSPPQILDVDIRGWVAGSGQEIRIRARDNFLVLSICLMIRDKDFVREAGEALQSETDSLLWTYITRTPVTREPGVRLSAFAFDLPGNVGEYHLELR